MPPEQQEIITAVAQAVKQGVNPNEILKRLKKMGMSEEDAYNLIRSVAQTVQQTDQESQQMDENPGMAETMKAGGTFSGNLFYQTGGGYIPEYGNMAYGGYHSEIPRVFNQPVDRPNKAMYGAFSMAKGGAFDNPGFKALPEFVQEKIMAASGKAMYGMGMAKGGGQMPQWLAERRFAAAGNMDKMSDYGYAEGGQYNIGDEIDVTPQELEMLKQQGYKFEILD